MKNLKDIINEALLLEAKFDKNYANLDDKRLSPAWLDDEAENDNRKYCFLPNTPKIKKAAVSPIAFGKYWIAFDKQDNVDATLEKLGFEPEDWGAYDEAIYDPEFDELLEILQDGGANC